ncbi:serine O-acetyltransferase [Aerococcus urinaeequi]|uniref:serine O-acetyltransferase n=1 Tax=Aerococcus urinaeequi TaxID=51665 RepID=UPI003B3B6764
MANLVGKSLSFGRKYKNVPFLTKGIRMINRVVFSCDIIPETEIHDSVIFSHHGLGVVINQNAKIGANTKILQNVTIGGKGTIRIINNQEVVAPIIGENVLIGSGAQIIGPITIGDNVIIGSGAIVTRDFPDNVVVAGVPATVIKNI